MAAEQPAYLPATGGQPYADSAEAYLAAGWPCVLPVPPESKTPPPQGYTGEHGRDTGPAEVAAMIAGYPGHSVALRMPDGVIGIDVDDYPKGQTVKRGSATLAHFVALYGPLPATWSSTARGHDGPSRIMFFRAPAGRYRSLLGPDVEIIQRHHRYAVVAPSWHHDVRAPYTWYDPSGRPWVFERGLPAGQYAFPGPAALAELPAAWAQGLREGAAAAGVLPADTGAGWAMLSALQAETGEQCAEVYSARLKALEILKTADPGSRHDSTVPRVHHLIMLGAKGHPGVGPVLAELGELWASLTAGESRSGEFERMLLTSARKAVTEVGRTEPVPGDPCLLMYGGTPLPGNGNTLQGNGNGVAETPQWTDNGAARLVVPPGGVALPAGVGIFSDSQGLGGPQAYRPNTPPSLGPLNGSAVQIADGTGPYAGQHSAPGLPSPLPPVLPQPALDGHPPWPTAPGAGSNGAGPSTAPPAGPAPQLPAGGAPLGPEAQPFNMVAAIGTGPFDPDSLLDQPLADAVLERVGPVLRYASDANTWLARAADRWNTRTDLSGWAVGFLARFMPAGDPGADKGSPEQRRYARRSRLLSTPGRNAVASAMRDVVRCGGHPVELELAELDSDPEILWAGGVPWDLAASLERPVPAQLDPGTPHLHSATVLPVPGPTPLWDAFLTAVWPDPEVRVWAVRVLSVALTGYPDATMPVMVGERDRGKTQVVSLLLDTLGTYGIAANPKLLNSGDNSHDTIVYALKGARMAFIDEGPRSGHLAQERLKQLTGGGRLTGRDIGKGEVRWDPTHTLVLTANDEPTLTDAALRKRVRLIPCEGDVAEIRTARRAIGSLRQGAWVAERPAVLASLMVEAARWLADRDSALTEAAPLHIRQRLEEVAAEQDPVREWLESETEPWEQGTPVGQLYEAFVAWWRRTGRSAGSLPSSVKLGRELTDKGYPRRKTRVGKGTQWLRDLRIAGPGGGGGWGFSPPVPGPATGPAQLPGPPVPVPVTAPVASQQTPSSTAKLATLPPANAEKLGQTGVQATVTNVPVPAPCVPTSGNTESGNTGNTPEPLTCSGDYPTYGVPVEPSVPVPVPTEGGTVATSRPEPGTHQTPSSTAKLLPIVPTVPTYFQESTTTTTHLYVNVESAIEISGGNTPHREQGPGREGAAEQPALPLEMPPAPTREELKASKAAQRKLEAAAKREAARLAAIRSAEGPLVDLPAVVDRQTRSVTSVSVARGAEIVAAEVAQWGALTLDVETTGYPLGHPHYALRTAQLGGPAFTVVWDTDDDDQRAAVAEAVAAAERLEAHSAQADLVPLVHAGLADRESCWARVWDTVIPAKLADPAMTGSDPSLKAVAPAVLGAAAISPAAEDAREVVFKAGKWLTDTEADTPLERSGWAMINKRSTTMVRYAGADVLDTAALGRLIQQPSAELWERERVVQRQVSRISHDGLRLDAERVAQLREEHEAARAELQGPIQAYGIENPGSPRQVAAALAQLGARLPLTEKGAPSAAKGALEPLRAVEGLVGQLAGQVLDWRGHDTALKLFLRPWTILVDYDPADPRVRCTVYTLSADTGRMSCVRFNLQQLSRTGGIRSCITALPGYVLISADFSGVEVRTAAALSQDQTLIGLLRAGLDVHAEVAKVVFGPPPDKAEAKRNRYTVKPMVFGDMYGAAVGTMAVQGGTSDQVAQMVKDAISTLAPQYRSWAETVKAGVRRGQTEFPAYSGRVIHLDRRQPHKAPNYEIQGTARELLCDALIRWNRTRWAGCITVPVHDEILAMVPEDEAEGATAALVECMRTSLYGVPIEVEASKPSYFWADAS